MREDNLVKRLEKTLLRSNIHDLTIMSPFSISPTYYKDVN